ncbi:MAG: EAL domain-containing protein [Bacillota bacterium]
MNKCSGKILIVDDNKDIHEDIKYILNSSAEDAEYYHETRLLREELFGLNQAGRKNEAYIKTEYTIDDAYQGEEAVRMVEAAINANDPYSLIFMDVRMPPGIDGIKAIERIWKIDPDVCVVICTTYSDYSWDQIVMNLGQNDNLLFIRKPFDNVSLKQVALAMTTKWKLKAQVNSYIENLERQVEMRTIELTEMVDKLKNEIALRREKEKQLAYSAHYDSLTEMLNRRSFYSTLSEITSGQSYNKDGFALFFIDLDDFKSINDIYGHDAGDRLLVEVAGRIRHAVGEHALMVSDRIGDGGEVEAIFRLGGDEFTVIVEEDDREKAGEIAQAVIDAIKKPYFISGHEIMSSCCIGVSFCQNGITRDEDLLKYADIALYEAKKVNGVYKFFDMDDSISYINDLKLGRDLKKAVDRGQIDVYFQRLVNTKDKTVGAQALARWFHPEFGELTPDRFIHVAEKTDQIVELGACILKKSVRYLKEIHKSGYDNLFVMVNCTTREFYHPGYADLVREALKDAGLEPNFLKLNLDDKFTFQATPMALEIIRELNSIGVQFAINGFDSDYPAFAFLKQVPRDTIIKLNKEYVKNIATDTRNRNFLLALMDIIKTWDLGIIISGIETREQKQILDKQDCILQGYHFNVPKPIGQFIEELKAGV